LKSSCRNIQYYLKNYQISLDKEVKGNTVFFIIDSKNEHPGLTDRLKPTIFISYIARLNDFGFKIIFDHPFLLSDFLNENEINWKATYEDLSFSVKNSRIIAYDGNKKIPLLDKRIKQYHIYIYNEGNLFLKNNILNWTILWGGIFNSLFKPSVSLTTEIKNTNFEKGNYIAVHFRFVNALDSFEQGYFNSLNHSDGEKLIERCLKMLFKLKEESEGREILIFSDSQRFIGIAKENGFSTLSGKIGHISFSGNDSNVAFKTFVDFYMMARASQVYRTHAPEMYKSAFCYYAALTGGKEAIDLEI
jgi:hypothetical protein